MEAMMEAVGTKMEDELGEEAKKKAKVRFSVFLCDSSLMTQTNGTRNIQGMAF